MNVDHFTFATDTAVLCAFDPARLTHRLNDDADWWTVPTEELLEVNQGNVVFLGLGTDGIYSVSIVTDLSSPSTTTNLKVESGRVFIGAGEEVTSAGLEPEGLRGVFVTLPIGNYTVSASRKGFEVTISFKLSIQGTNDRREPVNI